MVNAGITLTLHVWSLSATVLTIFEPPSETADTRSQLAVSTKSWSLMLSTIAALHTTAATKDAPRSLVTKPFQNVTIVKNWLPHTTMNAVALTHASASQASVLNSELLHVQKVMNESSVTPMLVVQLLDALLVIQQPSPPLLRQQHHTLLSLQVIQPRPPRPLHQHIPLLLSSHHQNATQSASTTRVKKFTMAIAGHQKSAHTVNAMLTVRFNARRQNAPP
jgi:hypothetical protein